MKLGLHANMYDSDTQRICRALNAPFNLVGKETSGEYGGIIEHLWIDFELIRRHAELRPPFRFRLQKKVGGSTCRLSGLPTPVSFNVGHYSVRPDFDELLSISPDQVVVYVLTLIYVSTEILLEKQKRLGGFDATRFRSTFAQVCRNSGHPLPEA